MNVERKMTPLGRLGRFRLYYAERRGFAKPGLHLWTGKQHVRILPLPKR